MNQYCVLCANERCRFCSRLIALMIQFIYRDHNRFAVHRKIDTHIEHCTRIAQAHRYRMRWRDCMTPIGYCVCGCVRRDVFVFAVRRRVWVSDNNNPVTFSRLRRANRFAPLGECRRSSSASMRRRRLVVAGASRELSDYSLHMVFVCATVSVLPRVDALCVLELAYPDHSLFVQRNVVTGSQPQPQSRNWPQSQPVGQLSV